MLFNQNRLIAYIILVTAVLMSLLVFDKQLKSYVYERDTVPVEVLVAQTEQLVKDKTGQDYKVTATEWTQPRGLLITGTVGENVVKFYCRERKGVMSCKHAQTNNTVFLNE